jgi:hypothetical protein
MMIIMGLRRSNNLMGLATKGLNGALKGIY